MIQSYKGFKADMTCRGKQYEEGKTYTEDKAKVYYYGMHACADPTECFGFYPPSNSVYRSVLQDGEIDEEESFYNHGSQRASSILTVGKRTNIDELIEASIIYKCSRNEPKTQINIDNHSSEISVSQDHGVSSTKSRGMSVSKMYGISKSGCGGISVTSDFGIAECNENGMAVTGENGIASSGEGGMSVADRGGMSTSGDWGMSVSRGSSSSGYYGTSVARGHDPMVKGGIGAILVIIKEDTNDGEVLECKTAIVDREKIKENTWYRLENGEFVEVSDVGFVE